jgi:hypothetical protein
MDAEANGPLLRFYHLFERASQQTLVLESESSHGVKSLLWAGREGAVGAAAVGAAAGAAAAYPPLSYQQLARYGEVSGDLPYADGGCTLVIAVREMNAADVITAVPAGACEDCH